MVMVLVLSFFSRKQHRLLFPSQKLMVKAVKSSLVYFSSKRSSMLVNAPPSDFLVFTLLVSGETFSEICAVSAIRLINSSHCSSPSTAPSVSFKSGRFKTFLNLKYSSPCNSLYISTESPCKAIFIILL